MSGEPYMTIVGNLVADPVLSYTNSGKARISFKVAATPRIYDRNSGQWKDGEALFMRCNAWDRAAENMENTLKKGMRVIAYGRLTQRTYETREGEKRTIIEMQVDEIGPTLRYATAQVERQGREGGGQSYGGQHYGDGGGFGGQNYGAQSYSDGQASNNSWSNVSGGGFGNPQFDAPQGGQANDPWAQDTNEPDEPQF